MERDGGCRAAAGDLAEWTGDRISEKYKAFRLCIMASSPLAMHAASACYVCLRDTVWFALKEDFLALSSQGCFPTQSGARDWLTSGSDVASLRWVGGRLGVA